MNGRYFASFFTVMPFSLARYLSSLQDPHGSFQAQLEDGSQVPSPFFTALILDILCQLPSSPALEKIKTQAAHYLLSQKSPHWSWNYIDRASPSPYPDDVDDTACALAALSRHNPNLLDGEAWAHILSVLTQQEIAPGGPYRTWIISPHAKDWQDVDPVVNANIGYFLQSQAISLPPLQAYITHCLQQKSFHSPYYPTPAVGYYFLSRYLKEDIPACPPTGPLTLALAALTGPKDPQLLPQLQEILQEQSWGSEPFCTDSRTHGAAHCPALTACLVVAAQRSFTARRHTPQPDYPQQLTAALSSPLREQAKTALENLLAQQNTPQTLALPRLFQQALGGSSPFIQPLTEATILGWLAYSTIDDFLDDEGDPKNLPMATWSLRRMLQRFQTVCADDAALFALVQQILDRIDVANTWEVTHCRATIQGPHLLLPSLPSYPDLLWLAERSLGHALAPLILLGKQGLAPDSEAGQLLLQFFQRALAARQLNDDLHDWEADLRHGHLSLVVSQMLAANYPDASKLKLEDVYENLRQYFWEKQIITSSNVLLTATDDAYSLLARCTFLKHPEKLIPLLKISEDAAKKALREHHNVSVFLGTYTGTTVGGI